MRIFQLCTAIAILITTQSAYGQVGQLGGGATGGAGGAGGSASAPADAGSTTEGAGGLTTQGPGAAAQEGGAAGGNIADFFVGGNALEAFVGGGITTDRNNNRQFRAITTTDVPTGGNTQATGTPRRIPVSLKVAFSYPSRDEVSSLTELAAPNIPQVAMVRPEFRSIAVSVGPRGVATLSGSVPDASVRRLAANLVRLRPGVRKVENNIMISTE